MSVDYLSCGTCFISFHLSDINQFIEHKKQSCFPTASKAPNSTTDSDDADFLTKTLECVQCFSRFSTPWSLLMHVQIVHNLLIIDNLKKAQLLRSNLVCDKNKLSCPEQDETESTPIECQNSTSHSTTIPTQSTSVSTQTDLSVLRKRAIPHRKRKYFECCSSENTLVGCPSSTAPGLKAPSDPAPCCDPLPTRLCPCTPSETNSVGSTVCVRSYCCPTLSVYNQPKCAELASKSLPESNSTVPCTNPISNCCLSKASCCAVPTRVLSVCCNQTVRSSPGNSVTIPQTNQTKVEPLSCCPCPPSKQVANNSSEAQTDFDPEFSYSDYVDLAMLLASPEDGGPSSGDFNLTSSQTEQPAQTNIVSPPIQNNNLMSSSTTQLTNSSSDLNMLTPVLTDSDNVNVTSSTVTDTTSDFAVETPQQLLSIRPKLSSTIVPSFGSDLNPNKNLIVQPKSRSFTCSECGATFRQNVHLRKHIMIQHTKQKPYQCTYCSYTTVEKSHLTVHVRTHTGERPFRCRVCNYSSAQNCTLKSHYLRKHPQHLVYCSSCSQGFLTELEMSRHKCPNLGTHGSNRMLITN